MQRNVLNHKMQLYRINKLQFQTLFQTFTRYIVLGNSQKVLDALVRKFQTKIQDTILDNYQLYSSRLRLECSGNTSQKFIDTLARQLQIYQLYTQPRQFQIEQLGSSRFISQTVIDLLLSQFYIHNLDSYRYYSQKVLDILLGRQFQIYLLYSSSYTIRKLQI